MADTRRISETVESLTLAALAAREAARVVLAAADGEAGDPSITHSRVGITMVWSHPPRSLTVHINSDGGYVMVAADRGLTTVVHGDAVTLHHIEGWVEWLVSSVPPARPSEDTAAHNQVSWAEPTHE